LVRTVPASGRLVVNAEQDSLHRVLAMGHWSEVALFGASHHAAWQLRGEPSDFEVLHQGEVKGRVQWSLGGVHNQMNALAAVIAADHVGVAVAHACQALSTFENVRRRMEVRGTVGTGAQAITVYDDFAHHPTAIRTTLDGLRRQVGTARILAVFEPRSNTMKLGEMKSQLPWSLEQADMAFCHTAGLDWDAAQALSAMGARAHTASNIDTLVAQVKAAARPGDHLLCMSNGGFGGVHDKLLQALKT
jgi:UDP-N-acetylmuramate: L-alanyl-gamma-D-glutamyl-meso-diaminopimelate ligase